jgi:integrase
MAQALTPAFVASAVCPDGKPQVEYFDSIVPNLALRVGKAGTKAWTLFMREGGKRRRVALGSAGMLSLAEARTAARQILGGRAPARPSGTGQTFEALADLFLQRCSGLRPTTIEDYRRTIATMLMPRWKNKPVAAITRDDIFKVLDPIVARGAKVRANRVQQVIVALLNVAVDRGWVATNVARGIRRVGGKETPRERALEISDLATLWGVLGGMGRQGRVSANTVAAIRFIILTAARKSEVRGLRWIEIDLDTALWMLPAARSKNRRDHEVPLSVGAMAILAKQRPYDAVTNIQRYSELVFSGVPRELSSVMRRACKLAMIDPPVTIHDLRRSAATLMAGAGVSRVVLKAVLGHLDRDVTAVYDRHSYAAEKREAVNKLDALIQQELGLMADEAREAGQPT